MHRKRGFLITTLLLAAALFPVVGDAAPPGAATLVAPSGTVSGTTITFTWQAGANATFYYLQVNDAMTSPLFTLWYPAEQACPGSSATCFVTITTGFAVGEAVWWVQTWNPDGFGPWSDSLKFRVRFVAGSWEQYYFADSAPQRFQMGVVLNGGVLDRETGLVWEPVPGLNPAVDWVSALRACRQKLSGRRAWRLPSYEELTSLLDAAFINPALTFGHPFLMVSTTQPYWSATTNESNAAEAYVVSFADGTNFLVANKGLLRGVWCVRGGASADNPR